MVERVYLALKDTFRLVYKPADEQRYDTVPACYHLSGGATSRGQLARIALLADAFRKPLKDGTLSDIFPQSNIPGGRIAAIDKNFKLPQVWRTSLGFDIKLPLEMDALPLEGVYTNDLNSITFENINLQPAAGTGTGWRPDYAILVKQYQRNKIHHPALYRCGDHA